MFDVARAFSRRVPFGRLIQIEPEIRPYLATLLLSTMAEAKERIPIPARLAYDVISDAEFDQHLLAMATKNYPNYGLL